MKKKEFERLLAEMRELTPAQHKHLAKQLTQVSARQAALVMVERRLGDAPVCPHCGSAHPQRWGAASGLQRYRCHACKKTFNALTGTPMARLRHKEKWLSYSEQLTDGSSVRKSAQAVGVHRNTAFRWRHRFLALPQGQQAGQLSGIAEADETYFLESFKGKKRAMPRASRKRGGVAKKRGLSDEQVPVLVARDRSGATADAVLIRVTAKTVAEVLGPLLARDAILCTDGNPVYEVVAKELDVTLQAVNLAADVRVLDKVFHVQNVNAYDSRLKGWMDRFHGVATRHLASYLGWRRLLERYPSGLASSVSCTPPSVLAGVNS